MKLCKYVSRGPQVVTGSVKMGGRAVILFVVWCAVSALADRKMTISEKLKEDADLSQVSSSAGFEFGIGHFYFSNNGLFPFSHKCHLDEPRSYRVQRASESKVAVCNAKQNNVTQNRYP